MDNDSVFEKKIEEIEKKFNKGDISSDQRMELIESAVEDYDNSVKWIDREDVADRDELEPLTPDYINELLDATLDDIKVMVDRKEITENEARQLIDEAKSATKELVDSADPD